MDWLNAHCARLGRPEHASVTGAAKFPIGVRVTVVFTDCPTETVGAEEGGAAVKSGEERMLWFTMGEAEALKFGSPG